MPVTERLLSYSTTACLAGSAQGRHGSLLLLQSSLQHAVLLLACRTLRLAVLQEAVLVLQHLLGALAQSRSLLIMLPLHGGHLRTTNLSHQNTSWTSVLATTTSKHHPQLSCKGPAKPLTDRQCHMTYTIQHKHKLNACTQSAGYDISSMCERVCHPLWIASASLPPGTSIMSCCARPGHALLWCSKPFQPLSVEGYLS